jgi:hypothetical protein
VEVLASEATYEHYVRSHQAAGFTDFATVLPDAAGMPLLRRIARDVVPALRELAPA